MSVYHYAALTAELESLQRDHPRLPVFRIGKSVQGRDLYALKLGSGSRRVFFNGAHHGMEWVTSWLLMKFARDLLAGGREAETLLAGCTLYLVPMLNPDGVEIAAAGKPWQANARGVDLNHNYDALWSLSKQAELREGILGPGPTRFGGPYPESEPESRAAADFTRQNSFDLALAFHSQGEVIYWDFCGFAPDAAFDYGRRFEAVSPYRMDVPGGMAAYGGYKDWFIRTFKRPGFTIEVGRGENPLPEADFPEIYRRTAPLMREALK